MNDAKKEGALMPTPTPAASASAETEKIKDAAARLVTWISHHGPDLNPYADVHFLAMHALARAGEAQAAPTSERIGELADTARRGLLVYDSAAIACFEALVALARAAAGKGGAQRAQPNRSEIPNSSSGEQRPSEYRPAIRLHPRISGFLAVQARIGFSVLFYTDNLTDGRPAGLLTRAQLAARAAVGGA